MRISKITVGAKRVIGYQIALPKANLVLAATKKGFICCGYLDMKTAEKLGDVACKVTGVKTVRDLLARPVIRLTSHARAVGIRKGMIAREVIERFL